MLTVKQIIKVSRFMEQTTECDDSRRMGHVLGVRIPTSGGKAGKGNAKTSTVQVVDGNFLVKQFRFVVADPESKQRAMQKAWQYIHTAVVQAERKQDE